MGDDVVIYYGTSETGDAAGSWTLKCNRVSGNITRDIKTFDLGTFSFLIDDLLSGYKLPNYITDFMRDKEGIKLYYKLIEGADGDDLTALEATLMAHRKLVKLTIPKYKYNWLNIGSNMAVDNTIVNQSGAGRWFIRIKDFDWEIDMEDQGGISCTISLITGFVARLID